MHSPLIARPAGERISVLSRMWAKLQLELLTPVNSDDITYDQWMAIEAARYNPSDSALRYELPIIGAHFKQSAADDIMNWTHRQSRERDAFIVEGIAETEEKTADGHPLAIDRELEAFARAFGRDTRAMNRALFNADVQKSRATGGYVTRSLAPHLHVDQLRYDGIRYLARLNALPFEVVYGSDTFVMPSDVAEIFAAARSRDPALQEEAAQAKQALRDRKLLHRVDLGAVAITFGPRQMPDKQPFPPQAGTFHCSDANALNGAYSMLFQGIGYFRPAQ